MEQVSIERKENRFVKELLSPSDRLVVSSVRDFVEGQVMPLRRELEESSRGDFRLREEMQARLLPLGLQGGFLPEEFGGMNMSSALSNCLVAEEMGRGDASLFYNLAAGMLAMRPAVRAGNRAVLEAFAPRFAQEERVFTGCYAVAEPNSGSDAENPDLRGAGISAAARLEGDAWMLEGAKAWCVNAGLAGVYCVACVTGAEGEEEDLALIYVDGVADGMRFHAWEDMTGMRGCRLGGLELKGATSPADWRASGPGEDARLLRDNSAFARLLTAALAVGCAQGAFEEALSFTSDRMAAGKPIRQHTICAAILADIATGIQVARDAYVNAAYIYDRPQDYGDGESRHMLSRASMAKVFCCEAAIHATNRAMELMGSYGYVSDYYVEKYWRDARTLQSWEGGAHLARLDIARGYYDYDQFHRNELYELMMSRT